MSIAVLILACKQGVVDDINRFLKCPAIENEIAANNTKLFRKQLD